MIPAFWTTVEVPLITAALVALVIAPPDPTTRLAAVVALTLTASALPLYVMPLTVSAAVLALL